MIEIDDRAGSKDLYIPLKELGMDAILTRLDSADVSFMGNGPDGPIQVGIEHKKLSDALSCLKDSRLTAFQIPPMIRNYEHCWLMVQGIYKAGDNGELLEWTSYRKSGDLVQTTKWKPVFFKKRAFMYSDFNNWLNSIALQSPLRIKETRNIYESCVAIRDLYNYYQKPWKDHKTFKAIYQPPNPDMLDIKVSQIRKLAATLPGIGWELSKEIEAAFRTPKRMFSAPESEWVKIPGIGKKKAKEIMRVIEEQEERTNR
jgi:ERCC4-type nuclease